MVNRWLRTWSVATVVVTAGLLVLGSLVTSFRVGLADPVWPTEPWRLLLIDWSEPSAGFLVEHTHRLAGFTAGGMMAVLAFGLWRTEPNRGVRWFGLASLAGLLGAFGYLHGVLIRQAKEIAPGTPLAVPPAVAGLLVLMAGLALAAAVATAWRGSPHWGLRCAGVALLVCVMVQGLFGGLRVHLHALFGEGFAVTHAAFAQVVFGLTVGIMMGCRGSLGVPSALAVATVVLFFAQVVGGAVLRHTGSLLGPRLHLPLAFAAAIAACGLARRCAKPQAAVLVGLLFVQVFLGVESWMIRFANGFAAVRPVTALDAAVRSAHAVVGYALLATAVAVACSPRRIVVRSPELEAVA